MLWPSGSKEVRTHTPEMNTDNGYDLLAIHNNIVKQLPQGVGGAHVVKA